MKKFFFIPVFVIITITACKSSIDNAGGKVEVIDLESAVGSGKVFNLSELAEDIKYVALETTENSLIGLVPRVFIEGDFIFVQSGRPPLRSIKVFDTNGKYLLTFNRSGRGPEEYSDMARITVDRTSGGFIAYDITGDAGNIKEYDREGNYTRSVKVPKVEGVLLNFRAKTGNDRYLAVVADFNSQPVNINGVVFDSDSNIIFEIPAASFPDYLPEEEVEIITVGGVAVRSASDETKKSYRTWPPRDYQVNDDMRLLYLVNDTIFSIDSRMNYKPVYCINYGKYQNETTFKSEYTAVKGKHVNINASYYIETPRYIILNFHLRDFAHEPYEEYIQSSYRVITVQRTTSYGLYDKKTGIFGFMNHPVKGKPGIRDDIKNGPPYIPEYMSGKNTAAAIFSAIQIIEHAETNEVKGELKTIVSRLQDTDNPVVAICKFK